MSTISSFEDIKAWQKARQLVKSIYVLSDADLFKKDFELKNQIRRASISISSNIAEGFERKGSKEFSYFLNVAKGSAGEVRSQLYLAFDLGYINDSEFKKIKEECEEISKLIMGFINYLKNPTFNIKLLTLDFKTK